MTTSGSIKAILACDEEGGIARDGTLPWPNVPRDFQWFKDNTKGHVIIMGSATWKDDHMPSPLPLRKNVLITTNPDRYPGAAQYIQGDIAEQVKQVAAENSGLITWVIGGAKVIEQTLDVIDEFFISRIPGKFDCDTFLPLKDIEDKFTCTSVQEYPEVVFEIWKKK